jgi:hypothetical protein
MQTVIYREWDVIKISFNLSEFKSYLDSFYFLSTSVGFSVNKNILDNRFSNRETETWRAKFFFDVIKMGKPKELALKWLKQKNLKIELKLDTWWNDYDKERFQDTLDISDDFRRFLLKDINRIKYLFSDKLRWRYLWWDLGNLSTFIWPDIKKKYIFTLSTNIHLILRCLDANYFDIIPLNALDYTKKFARLIGWDEFNYQWLINDLFKMELWFQWDEDDEYFKKKLSKNKWEMNRIHNELKKYLIKDIWNYLGIEKATYESIIVSLWEFFERKHSDFIHIREDQTELLNEDLEDFLISSFQSDLILFSDWRRVQFMNLSSWEQVLLIRFSNILNSIYTSWKEWSNIIILIDEPDLHLHLNWQKEYILRLLQSLWREIKILWIHAHIIIATHSPFILSDITSRNCLVLGKENCIKSTFPTFWANFFDIIERWFFLDRTNWNYSHEIISYISKRIRILDTIKILLTQNNNKIDDKKVMLVRWLFEEVWISSKNQNVMDLYDSEYEKVNNLLAEIDDTFIKSNIKYYD